MLERTGESFQDFPVEKRDNLGVFQSHILSHKLLPVAMVAFLLDIVHVNLSICLLDGQGVFLANLLQEMNEQLMGILLIPALNDLHPVF